MERRVIRLIAAVGVALLGAAPAAMASTGVAVDVGRIAVEEHLAPGGEYRLPAFGVRNPGTEPATYRLVLSPEGGQTAASPSEAWFRFDPAELTLEPDASRAVHTRIVIPPDAEPGEYAVLIGPEIVAVRTGAQVGAAAAVRLTFTVGEAGGIDGWLRLLGRLLADNPWLPALAILVTIYVATRYLRRRFAISVTRRA
jgi:hypothetical protein